MNIIARNRTYRKNKEKYLNDVKTYLDQNIYIIVYGIRLLACVDEINYSAFKKIFGTSFPKSPRFDEEDYKNQIKCLLKALNIKISMKKRGNSIKEILDDYSLVVNTHVMFTGNKILENLTKKIELFNGRMPYSAVSRVLGPHYPKVSFALDADERITMVFFLYELGFVFKFDCNELFFV